MIVRIYDVAVDQLNQVPSNIGRIRHVVPKSEKGEVKFHTKEKLMFSLIFSFEIVKFLNCSDFKWVCRTEEYSSNIC